MHCQVAEVAVTINIFLCRKPEELFGRLLTIWQIIISFYSIRMWASTFAKFKVIKHNTRRMENDRKRNLVSVAAFCKVIFVQDIFLSFYLAQVYFKFSIQVILFENIVKLSKRFSNFSFSLYIVFDLLRRLSRTYYLKSLELETVECLNVLRLIIWLRECKYILLYFCQYFPGHQQSWNNM